jgi:hypothetical protein
MNLNWLKAKGKVQGLFQDPIAYNPLIPSGDSSPFFGTFNPQRFGQFDTDCCWDFSGCAVDETRLQMLWSLNLIPQDTKDWLINNKYCDVNGIFDVSDRWVAILSGVRDAGNNQLNFWQIAQTAGLIPNVMLPYDSTEAFKYNTKDDFNNDYFNPQVITKDMELMGKEFARRFKIQAENVKGGYFKDVWVELETYLQEGSMQIGIPVPSDGSWNQVDVPYPVGNTQAQHAVELYKFDRTQAFPFFIYDSYEPHCKQLQANYYIPFITRVSILPTPVLAPIPASTSPVVSSWTNFWTNVYAKLVGKPLPYPNVPVGSALGGL